MTRINELCKIKGHMLYVSKRKDVERKDGVYSVAIEKYCARENCDYIENIEIKEEK